MSQFAERPKSPSTWTFDKLQAARSSGFRRDDVKTLVVDIRRIKGQMRARETSLLSIPGTMWMLRDSGSRFFGRLLWRISAARNATELPGHLGGPQRSTPNPKLHDIIQQEILWLGQPQSCAGSIRDGESYPKKGLSWVVVTSPCTIVEYRVLVDHQTGLPRTVETWSPPMELPVGKTYVKYPWRCIDRLHYLSWNQAAWRMPTTVRLETNFRHAFGSWIHSEYAVSSWINPDLDPKFFDIEMTEEMTAETWRAYLRQ